MRFCNISRTFRLKKGFSFPRHHFRAFMIVYSRTRLRVLVPGAGLGRLAYDVASLGAFSCVRFSYLGTFEVRCSRFHMPRQRIFALHAFGLVFHFKQVRFKPLLVDSAKHSFHHSDLTPKNHRDRGTQVLPLRSLLLKRCFSASHSTGSVNSRRIAIRSASRVQLFACSWSVLS